MMMMMGTRLLSVHCDSTGDNGLCLCLSAQVLVLATFTGAWSLAAAGWAKLLLVLTGHTQPRPGTGDTNMCRDHQIQERGGDNGD